MSCGVVSRSGIDFANLKFFQECKDEELERYKKEVLQLRQQFEQLR